MAREGVLFTNHFCTASSCSPSRGSIITGRYPHCNGLMGLVNQAWELPLSEKTTPQYLKRAGYITHLFGLQHERSDRNALGYEHTTDMATVGTGCHSVSESLVQFLKAGPDEPFYVKAGFREPHRPFNAQRVEGPGRGPVPAYLPDNTMTVFSTDHGIDMPRAKATLYDPGIETVAAVGYMYPQRRPLTELYDLITDPQEMNSLSSNPQFRAVEEDLHRRLHEWMRETKDPLLEGAIPIPKFF